MPICLRVCLIMCIFALMKLTLKHIGMFFIMLFLSCALNAQRFVNVSLDGAQTVCSIQQDGQGMMWLGTENGLYCYDGYHSYKQYTEHTFSNTRVYAMAVDREQLFLATDKGMMCFNLQSNSYVQPSADATKDSGRKSTLEQRAILLKYRQIVFGSEVYALLDTPKGLLVGTLSGLYSVKKQALNGKNSWAKLNKQRILLPDSQQPLVNALAYDAKRRCYWIGTEGALYCADLQLKNFTRIFQLNGNSVKCLAEESNGNLYIGTDNGLYRLSLDNSILHFEHDSRDASSIPNNIVWSCFVDKWQNVWIGTDNGLSRLSTHTYFQYTSLDKITLSGEGNCLHEICQTRDGEWWLGGTNGLIRFGMNASQNASDGNVAWYKQNSSSYPLSHNRVRKIYEDRKGDVWVCTDHGVNYYNRQTKQMHNFIVCDKTGKYSTAWAYDVLEDKQGRMWMASYMGGIFVISKQRLLSLMAQASGSITIVADYHFSDQGKNALSGLHVGQMVIDAQDMVWASSFSSLDRINPQTMKVVPVEHKDDINYLMADSKGNVWADGNTEVKCFVINPSANHSQLKTKTWKIGGKVITMCDVDGKTWVVCGKECCVIDLDGKSSRFKIPSSIAPLAIFYSKAQHMVMMGGNDGYICLRADMPMEKGLQTKLMLAGIVVNGNQWQDAAPRNMKELELASDENSFTLQLTDLPFSDHPSAVYAYRLEGSDYDWHYLNKKRLDISYNGLPYGNYHLKVHVVDGEGNIGAEVYSLDITILPPWYLSIWAKLVYLLLAIVLAWGIMKFYLVRERLVEERRQKAEILEQVEARISFFNRLSEDLKTAVTHRSFDEILELTNRYLGVKIEKKEAEVPALNAADQRLLKEITETIETHMIDSDFNVTTLQEILGIGGKQLYRKLKAMTGKTPVEYIRELRMNKAAVMLKEGKFSVSEVMYTVGFSNNSYFSKCFSKAFGMTPTEYMKS